MATALHALEKQVCEVLQVGLIRVLPKVSVHGAKDQSVEDARGLRQGGRTIKVQIHLFLEGTGSDKAGGCDLDGEVQKIDAAAWC